MVDPKRPYRPIGPVRPDASAVSKTPRKTPGLLDLISQMIGAVDERASSRFPEGTLMGVVPDVSPKGPLKRLFRVEPKDLGDKGAWLQRHMTPEQWKTFVSERGRYFADEPMELFGHGAPDRNTFFVDVPEDVAARVRRMNADGYPEYVVPAEYVAKKRPFGGR